MINDYTLSIASSIGYIWFESIGCLIAAIFFVVMGLINDKIREINND